MSNDGLWDVTPLRMDQVYGPGIEKRLGQWVLAVFPRVPMTRNDLDGIVENPFDEGGES